MALEYSEVPLRSGWRQRITAFLTQLHDSYVRARAAEHTYDRLVRMSDDALAQYGVKREDIPAITMRRLCGGLR